MPRVRQGMIQRLEHYTSRLKSKDEKTVLRLRKGRIKKGAYKGTVQGRLKYFFSGRMLTKAGRAARHQYLKDVTETESRALADSLCKDISRRTPAIYEAKQAISAKDVKVLLKASADERARFDDIVDEFVETTTTDTILHESEKAAETRLGQHLMKRNISHHAQMQFLKKEVVAKLRTKSRRKKSRRPIDKKTGQPEKRLKQFKKARRLAERTIDSSMPTLALLQEAEQYAFRKRAQDMQGTEGPGRHIIRNGSPEEIEVVQAPIIAETQEAILQSLQESTPGATKKLVAELAVEHMIDLGVSVDPGDIPKRETKEQEEAFQSHLTTLRSSRSSWDHLIADLLEDKEYEKAILLEDIAKDSQPLQALETLRDKIADKAFSKDQKDRVRGLKKRKVIKRKGPSLKKKRPQDAIDRVMPWRGGHTHVETRMAKGGISFPLSMDGNTQGKEEIIQQTLNMLKAKYPELGAVHARGDLEVVREFLGHHVKDRTVTKVTPFTYVKQPLKELEKPLIEIEDDVSAEQILRSGSTASEGSDSPLFDLSSLEGETKSRTDSDLSTISFSTTDSGRSSRSNSMVEQSRTEQVTLRERSFSQDSANFDTEEVDISLLKRPQEEDDDDLLFTPIKKSGPPPSNDIPPEETKA